MNLNKLKTFTDIDPGVINEDEVQRLEENREEMDRYLGAYPYEK